MMSMVDPIVINVCPLEKEFSELIYMNRLIVLYLTFSQVDSCPTCVCGPLT